MRKSTEIVKHEQSVIPSRRLLSASILTACAINLCSGVLVTAKDSDTECVDVSNTKNLVASAAYDIDNGSIDITSGDMPESRKNIYTSYIPNAINDPIVQLALRTGDVTSLTASTSETMKGPLSVLQSSEGGWYDNDAHCNTEKEIILNIGPNPGKNSEKSVFANEYSTHLLVVHEAIHGLNDKWWHQLKETKAFDRIQDPRIYELQNSCDDLNKWLSSKNTGHMPESMPYPDNSTVAEICSIQAMTMDTAPLREAFRCVNEGDMLKFRRELSSTTDLGHPWDDPTELASSVTNILRFDPDYLQYCFTSQDALEATLITRYIKAILELSFLNQPELEHLLREDPKTAQAIDFLLSAA